MGASEEKHFTVTDHFQKIGTKSICFKKSPTKTTKSAISHIQYSMSSKMARLQKENLLIITEG